MERVLAPLDAGLPRFRGSAMRFWLLVELTVAFIVFCADSVGETEPRPPVQRLVRSLCWPVTLTRWFTHRNLAKLARFASVVWFLVTTGWLISLLRDRIQRPFVFILVAEATMAFVVYCVDAMS